MKPEEVIELLKIQREDCTTSVLREDDIDLAIEALEKQIPKKPEREGKQHYACQCASYVGYLHEYCHDCGQKIDWSDEYD